MTYNIWLERTLPEKYKSMLPADIVVIGTASDTPDNPWATIAQAHAIIAGGRLTYNQALMNQTPQLQVIARTGIGVDNIDLAAATERGIAICNTPDGPTISTAEHTVALIFAVARQLAWCRHTLHNNTGLDFFNTYQGLELDQQRLGLIGLGRIGGRVAKIAQGLGMRVLGYDPYISADQARSLGVIQADSLPELLQTADVVSLHVPLGPDTQHLMNEERLALMKPGAILINAARGGLVDESALLKALEAGHLRGVGLDVFATEPPPADHPLLNRLDVIATPHIAAATRAGKDRLWQAAIEQVIQVLHGQRPSHLINPQVWD